MPRKSKYVREKEALLQKLSKSKLSDVSEAELLEHLETLKDDEALSSQLASNWRRATTKPKFRDVPTVVTISSPVPEKKEEARTDLEGPNIVVHDLGIRDGLLGSPGGDDEGAQVEVKEEAETRVAPSMEETLLAIFVQNRAGFEALAQELVGLRVSLAILAGMVAATFFMVNWGDRIMSLFS